MTIFTIERPSSDRLSAGRYIYRCIYVRVRAHSGSRPTESSCCIEAIIVFRSTPPRTTLFLVSAQVLADHNPLELHRSCTEMVPSFPDVASFSGKSDNALLNCVCTRATLLHFMPDPNQKRTNSALWLGLLITVPGPRGSTWPYQPSACSSF